MESFKIDLFNKEYKTEFPNYVHLSESYCLILIDSLSKRYGTSIVSMVEDLNSKQTFIENVDTMNGFKVIDALKAINIKPLSKIYINWYKFNDIDLLNLIDLDKYFYDIWFSGADDIDLFDESLDWIFTIRHDGCTSFLIY
jgi:hypothetical protein